MQELVAFAESENLGTIEPNQWDLTYVNHLVKGREWQSPKDWQEVLPGIIGSTDVVSSGVFEAIGMHLSFVLPRNSGRLHVELTHGSSILDDEAQEVLLLQFTARGGITDDQDYADGLGIGHQAIVRSFAEITGERVRKEVWKQEAAKQ